MGMDVYGIEPTSEQGGYFRNNVWWWRPLWDYVANPKTGIASDLIDEEGWNSGHCNDGYEVAADKATAIAKRLRALVAGGDAERHAKLIEASNKALPPDPCELCNQTGIRADSVGRSLGQHEKIVEDELDALGNPHPRKGQIGWCNGCRGAGYRASMDSYYPFSVENVEEFAAFAEASGGFQIC